MSAFCSSCGTELTPGARFCASCGTPAAHSCSSCGSPSPCGAIELPAGAAFCPACGAKQEASAPAELSANEELRMISAMFVDLAEFDGKPGEAYELFVPVIGEADRRQMRFYATQARVEAARCATSAGRSDEAAVLIATTTLPQHRRRPLTWVPACSYDS